MRQQIRPMANTKDTYNLTSPDLPSWLASLEVR